jgi:SNF2 family DNA or RNA helicase
LCDKLKRPVSKINGDGTNLDNYNKHTNSITLVQYQSGASGVNLQLSNKIIYFALPLSCDMYMQSKKRIHRIGQSKTCFYYYLQTKNSIESKIYDTLQKRQDYTLDLFERSEN